MTDSELVARVLGVFDPGGADMFGLSRSGRLLLGLPSEREAALRALQLYQPQRRLARGMVAVVHGLLRYGLQRWMLPRLHVAGDAVAVSPALNGIEPGTCGVLLGSPEHRVRRAIASYRNAGAWEVAKISFGESGAQVLEQEARALGELEVLAAGVPKLLGLHHGADVTVLRMPYLTGRPIALGEYDAALRLLDQWRTGQPPKAIIEFSEWMSIASGLAGCKNGDRVLERLSREVLRPVICHGDFTRWNLLRRVDGSLVVLDWEWGHRNGLPGIDLVHYFLQDARLVMRLNSVRAIKQALTALDFPASREYLRQTGWGADPMLPIIACLAYKQGAGHQDNREVLETLVAMASYCG